jgi:hypothetical protein
MLVMLALACVALPARAGAQEPRDATATVFARFASRILKVQVIESGSSARASIGTGFFVSADGLMLTNYHVIAEHIHEPENYRVEVLDSAGTATAVAVIAVDVVHDLAVLRTGLVPREHFTLAPVAVRQGERLYSLGHPSDLGLSIVEGTYNGNLRHTLYPKIHFTGSINPGMSGGPTITEGGQVVGVNVSTMGEQRSFLVPGPQAEALVTRAAGPGYEPPVEFLPEIARQLGAYQEEYLGRLFEGEPKLVDIGEFRVVTEPSVIFRCWGDADRSTERLYERLRHSCSTDDDVFIAGDQSSGMIDLEHEVLVATGLNAPRFAALYTRHFSYDHTPGGDEKHVTEWACSTRNVSTEAATMRAVLCLRRLRKLDGLYDATLKVAVLGARDTGLISTLTLSGASHANIERLTARYLELITWR